MSLFTLSHSTYFHYLLTSPSHIDDQYVGLSIAPKGRHITLYVPKLIHYHRIFLKGPCDERSPSVLSPLGQNMMW